MLVIEMQKYIKWCEDNNLEIYNVSSFLSYMDYMKTDVKA